MIRDRVFFLAAGHGAHPDGTELKPRRWFVTQEMRTNKSMQCFRAGVANSGRILVPATLPIHLGAAAIRPTPDVRICTRCFRMAPYHVKGCPRYTEAVGDGLTPPAGVVTGGTVRPLGAIAQKVADWLYGDAEQAYVAPWVGVRPRIRWYCRLFYWLRKAVRKL